MKGVEGRGKGRKGEGRGAARREGGWEAKGRGPPVGRGGSRAKGGGDVQAGSESLLPGPGRDKPFVLSTPIGEVCV